MNARAHAKHQQAALERALVQQSRNAMRDVQREIAQLSAPQPTRSESLRIITDDAGESTLLLLPCKPQQSITAKIRAFEAAQKKIRHDLERAIRSLRPAFGKLRRVLLSLKLFWVSALQRISIRLLTAHFAPQPTPPPLELRPTATPNSPNTSK